jgi:hypothetical protein
MLTELRKVLYRTLVREYDWRQLLEAHRTGGDEAFDKKWAGLYGIDEPAAEKTVKLPAK